MEKFCSLFGACSCRYLVHPQASNVRAVDLFVNCHVYDGFIPIKQVLFTEELDLMYRNAHSFAGCSRMVGLMRCWSILNKMQKCIPQKYDDDPNREPKFKQYRWLYYLLMKSIRLTQEEFGNFKVTLGE
jgi:hypothetical protein